jgi:peptide deformylase
MEILTHPSPALKQVSAEVDPISDTAIKPLVKQMAYTMYDAPGIGLAAPQIGILKRVIVYDLDEELVAVCNPRITAASSETVLDDEACLSVPGITIPVARSVEVTCEGLDLRGDPISITATDLHARLLQHEIDHLDGYLILDRATPEERKAALRRYLEVASAG